MLKTAAGDWLRVKRDIPTASASTFLSVFRNVTPETDAPGTAVGYICALVRWGAECAEKTGKNSGCQSIPPTALRAGERGLRSETQTPQQQMALVFSNSTRARDAGPSPGSGSRARR